MKGTYKDFYNFAKIISPNIVKLWEDFNMRERRKWKPQIRRVLWYESLWHELHICGKCRKAIAEYLPKDKSMECLNAIPEVPPMKWRSKI